MSSQYQLPNVVRDDIKDTGVIYYICGDCAVRVPLEPSAPIRCQKCGARVLYKERTKRMVQFEAR
ncbi:DNA directed RNA polymerase [Cladorrhinum sp. PSN259]|nr:DNA directed RNA polymerase [Cladorrhinum sp. PSN259]